MTLIVRKLTVSLSVTAPIVQDDTDNGMTDDDSGETNTTPSGPSNPDDDADNGGGKPSGGGGFDKDELPEIPVC